MTRFCQYYLVRAFATTTMTAAETSLLKLIRVFQTLSRLFEFVENVKCRRISLELISLGPHSSLEREGKNSLSLVYVLHKTS